jgi:hypothetical protein
LPATGRPVKKKPLKKRGFFMRIIKISKYLFLELQPYIIA